MCEVGGGDDKSCCISLDDYKMKSSLIHCVHVNILGGNSSTETLFLSIIFKCMYKPQAQKIPVVSILLYSLGCF